jgi:hypothetical protein
MVSEDSDSLGAVFPPIHRCRQLCDSIKPLTCKVVALCHPFYALSEFLEVIPFRRLQRMFFKERDDDFKKLTASAYNIAIEVLLVVVLTAVDDNSTDAKELVELSQGFQATLALSHGKLVEHLYSDFVARAMFSLGLLDKPY